MVVDRSALRGAVVGATVVVVVVVVLVVVVAALALPGRHSTSFGHSAPSIVVLFAPARDTADTPYLRASRDQDSPAATVTVCEHAP